MNVDGVVLAGGRSQRFGSDKSVATLNGRTLLATCHKAMAGAVGGRVYIAAGSRELVPWPAGAVRVADECSGAGPLAGITAALACTHGAGVLVLACDLPRVRTATLHAIGALGVARGRAVAARGSRGWEPLLAFYPRAALQQLRSGLREGPRALHLWLDRLGALAVTGIGAGELININRVSDLERLVRRQARDRR